MGGQNYSIDLTKLGKREPNWKDKLQDTYILWPDRLTSMDVTAHDIQVHGAVILSRWNVLHAFLVEIPPSAIALIRSLALVKGVERQHDLKALHGAFI